jgi:hypothetical protein
MLDDLPQPIKDEIMKSVNFHEYQQPENSFGVKELLYCLRQKIGRASCRERVSERV